MSVLVCSGAKLWCTYGDSEGTLVVQQPTTVMCENKPTASANDCTHTTSVTPCGFCHSLTNPNVASATAAAFGSLTPMPCNPLPLVWSNVSTTVLIGKSLALTNKSRLRCAYGGELTIANPGQFTVSAE